MSSFSDYLVTQLERFPSLTTRERGECLAETKLFHGDIRESFLRDYAMYLYSMRGIFSERSLSLPAIATLWRQVCDPVTITPKSIRAYLRRNCYNKFSNLLCLDDLIRGNVPDDLRHIAILEYIQVLAYKADDVPDGYVPDCAVKLNVGYRMTDSITLYASATRNRDELEMTMPVDRADYDEHIERRLCENHGRNFKEQYVEPSTVFDFEVDSTVDMLTVNKFLFCPQGARSWRQINIPDSLDFADQIEHVQKLAFLFDLYHENSGREGIEMLQERYPIERPRNPDGTFRASITV